MFKTEIYPDALFQALSPNLTVYVKGNQIDISDSDDMLCMKLSCEEEYQIQSIINAALQAGMTVKIYCEGTYYSIK